MKALIRLWKMFYRLLRLKSYQRKEIERMAFRDFCIIQDRTYKEHHEFMQELSRWHRVAHKYMMQTPEDLACLLYDLNTLNTVAINHLKYIRCISIIKKLKKDIECLLNPNRRHIMEYLELGDPDKRIAKLRRRLDIWERMAKHFKR